MFAQLALHITYIVITIVEFLIGIRILLKLFGASASAEFVRWVYETTDPLLSPFVGMFPTPRLSGVFVLEFSALFALVVYALVGYLIQVVLSEIAYQTQHAKKREH